METARPAGLVQVQPGTPELRGQLGQPEAARELPVIPGTQLPRLQTRVRNREHPIRVQQANLVLPILVVPRVRRERMEPAVILEAQALRGPAEHPEPVERAQEAEVAREPQAEVRDPVLSFKLNL